MARVLVVSRSMAVALRIADDHEVTEHPADQLEALIPGADVEAVVVDLGEPAQAMGVVYALRARGVMLPVLLLSGYQPEWADLEDTPMPDVRVVPLPITRQSLLAGIADLLGLDPGLAAGPAPGQQAAAAGPPVPIPVPAQYPEPADVPPSSPIAGLPLSEAGFGDDLADFDFPAEEPQPPEHPLVEQLNQVTARQFEEQQRAPRSGPSARARRLGSRLAGSLGTPVEAERAPGVRPEPGPPPPPLLPAPTRRSPQAPEEQPVSDVQPGLAGQPEVPADGLVRALLERIHRVHGVEETCRILAEDVVERADADAAAVLVPDGPIWRVSGGVGLRPMERRLVLSSTHWLVAEVSAGGRALLIEDTDIVRAKIAGAPLAAWQHVLAAPIPGTRSAVLLARGNDSPPFSERDLAAVVPVAREAAGLMEAAVRARELARALNPLREEERG